MTSEREAAQSAIGCDIRRRLAQLPIVAFNQRNKNSLGVQPPIFRLLNSRHFRPYCIVRGSACKCGDCVTKYSKLLAQACLLARNNPPTDFLTVGEKHHPRGRSPAIVAIVAIAAIVAYLACKASGFQISSSGACLGLHRPANLELFSSQSHHP